MSSSSFFKQGYSDIVLAFGVVGIVALMILPLPLPLPLFVADTLVALNILIAITLLLLAIYVPRPTAFSSFPSVILLSTLFRLSPSIAANTCLQKSERMNFDSKKYVSVNRVVKSPCKSSQDPIRSESCILKHLPGKVLSSN
ncbi:MAG: FHIPEP family type III secretion protein [Pseudomonadales bacterium]|nr:FHIPEP family type III secretion protein [Pseudomonadales bacterium]